MAVKPGNTVNNPRMVIVRLLVALAAYHRKHYCFPSQATIVELLDRFYGVRLSRRTLNRHLLALQLRGYIQRTKRRPTHEKKRGNVLHSTLYHVAGRYFDEMRGSIQRLAKIAKRYAGLATGIHVPKAAQYANTFLKDLYSAAGYPQEISPAPG